MLKKCTRLWLEVKMYKAHHSRTTSGSWAVEKVQAVVAQSTFRSQNVKNTPFSEHFWKLSCWKNAHHCGAKHISKPKCAKHRMLGPLLEVEMLKKCTRLWHKAHFRDTTTTTTATTTNATTTRTTTTLHYSYNYTTLHYATLIALQQHYTTLHRTTLHHATLQDTTPHYTTLHYLTLHYTNYPTLQLQLQLKLHYTTLKLQLQLQLQLHYNYNCDCNWD